MAFVYHVLLGPGLVYDASTLKWNSHLSWYIYIFGEEKAEPKNRFPTQTDLQPPAIEPQLH